ncbi:MAG: hypothetical protein IK045_07530, partial [Bacteroidales bacterium]|nr:hypothetical protein [Bacteroidales bacterium]
PPAAAGPPSAADDFSSRAPVRMQNKPFLPTSSSFTPVRMQNRPFLPTGASACHSEAARPSVSLRKIIVYVINFNFLCESLARKL